MMLKIVNKNNARLKTFLGKRKCIAKVALFNDVTQ